MKLLDILKEQYSNMSMGFKDPNQPDLDSLTNEFNQQTGEQLTSQQYNDIMGGCVKDQPIKTTSSSDEQTINQLKERMKGASLRELLQLRKQFRQIKRDYKKGGMNEQAGVTSVTLLGITMNPAVAIVASIGLIVFLLWLIGRIINPRVKTYSFECGRSAIRHGGL